MVSKVVDPRFRKTHTILQKALMSLIDEKPYDKITVNDIADQAQVNRSTFYLHYDDILALLNDCLLDGVTLKDAFPHEYGIKNNPEDLIERTTRYLKFTFDHPDLYLMVLKEFQINPYFSEFYEAILDSMCLYQKSLYTGDLELFTPDRQIARFVLAGLARLMSDWLKNQPSESLEKLACYYNVVQFKATCGLLGCEVPEWVKVLDCSTF